ncbi:MAG TPA: PIG-L family deacetylase [Albitalea sp.]|jgi:LmbE family N-acetylglucosaminyl deacetylase|nr:PIG-L family deacetylase [Albitalea sp.]
MLIISPHLDDAVLACGRLLAARPGSTVATLFAGVPRNAQQLTGWDARCGFRSAEAAIAARRREDTAALWKLHATPVWLDFCDAQYEEPPAPAALADAVRRLIAELHPDLLVYPLGLYHSDHLLAHDACRAALRALPDTAAAAYEDVLYRGMKGVLHQRLVALAAMGIVATPARLDNEDGSPLLKEEALQAYASQWRAFGDDGLADSKQPERCWTLQDG